ncbi:hypothetical protein HZH68_011664 [Vespula germanica]|uniref:Uncharacterized protein n=1 Tax=Vespula germanica TaxID=30212 RepID=A0A834MYI3_VESGE|nr:hypothetical protein HZH68_011664 [Vespula germanica]
MGQWVGRCYYAKIDGWWSQGVVAWVSGWVRGWIGHWMPGWVIEWLNRSLGGWWSRWVVGDRGSMGFWNLSATESADDVSNMSDVSDMS